MGRAPCCDRATVKRGPWSPEEDMVLRNYVQKYGSGGNWIALPRKAGLRRCGKSCRLRWLNYLRPDIKHGGYTEEEDNIICTLYKSIGSKWSVIASHLPGRTDNDVKNYWNTKLKKKMMSGETSLYNTIAIHTDQSPPPVTNNTVSELGSYQTPILNEFSEASTASSSTGHERNSIYANWLAYGEAEMEALLLEFGYGSVSNSSISCYESEEKIRDGDPSVASTLSNFWALS